MRNSWQKLQKNNSLKLDYWIVKLHMLQKNLFLCEQPMLLPMKKLLLSVGLLLTITIQAQEISTFLTTTGPYGGIIYEEDSNSIYVASEFNGVIYRKDAIGGDGTYQTINSGGTGAMQTGLFKLGAELYVNRWHDNAVMKVGIDTPVTPEAIATIPHPEGLTGRGNKLYVTSGTSIYEIDLTTSPATVSILMDGLEVSVFGPEIGLKIYNDYLYVSETNKISRINLNITPYVKETYINLTFTPLSFTWESPDFMHVTANDYQSIYSIINGTVGLLLRDNSTNYPSPNDLVYIADHTILVACMEGYNVMKSQVPVFLTENYTKPKAALYPNPATNYISVSNLSVPEDATVINTLGQTVAHYKATEKYDVSALPAGVYYLQLKGQSLKFVKE